MTTQRQHEQRRSDQTRLTAAANHARRTSRQQQAAGHEGLAPIVPVDRYTWIGLLDELALAAGRGELPAGVRRLALETADAVLREETTE